MTDLLDLATLPDCPCGARPYDAPQTCEYSGPGVVHRFRILCPECDAQTMPYVSEDDAILAWKRGAIYTLVAQDKPAAQSREEPGFECMAYDAHCPSMTVRFQVPDGFPLAGGIFRIRRVRTATPEDTALFAHLPDAPETFHDVPTGADALITSENSLFRRADFCLIGNTVANSAPAGGETALIFNVSDNATAWTTPWVVGHWSDDAQQWFDHEGYPLTPSHIVKLPSAEVFEKAEGIKP